MKRDQKFFDMYSLTIGVLAAVALAFLVIALKISDLTQGIYTRDAEEYLAAVNERIQPLSQVYLPGEDRPDVAATVQPVQPAPPVATQMTGPQVYNSACLACHGAGIAGAPRLGDAEAWAPRVEKGMATLNDHAINGFAGEAGYMPAKGGRTDLSDEEVAAAVEYMVAEST